MKPFYPFLLIVLLTTLSLSPVEEVHADAPPLTRAEHRCIKQVMDEYVQTHLEIYFIYDGCCNRALTLHEEIKKACGETAASKVEQLFLRGVLCPKKKIMWGFHTSLCVTMDDGSRYVLDPAFADEPIPYEKWVEMCRGKEGETSQCILQECNGSLPRCINPEDPTKDPERSKKKDCYFRCYGTLMNGYLQGDTIQDQKQRSEFRTNTMVDCKECEKRCKSEKKLDPPFLNNRSGETSSCEWAAQFEGSSREIPRDDSAHRATSCTDPAASLETMLVSTESLSNPMTGACTIETEFLQRSLFTSADLRLLDTIDESPEDPYPVEVRSIETPSTGECRAQTEVGIFYFSDVDGGLCLTEPVQPAAVLTSTPQGSPTPIPTPATFESSPTPAPRIATPLPTVGPRATYSPTATPVSSLPAGTPSPLSTSVAKGRR